MITLQHFTLNRIPQLVQWVHSPELLVQWAGPVAFTYPLNERQLERHLAQANGPEPRMLAYAALDADEEMVGYMELANIQRANGSASLSRVLVGPPEARGKGIGGQMVHAALRIGFEDLALHRISLAVFAHNRSAIACYRRAGFQVEGLLRDSLKMGNTYWSLSLMSMLEEEWRSRART